MTQTPTGSPIVPSYAPQSQWPTPSPLAAGQAPSAPNTFVVLAPAFSGSSFSLVYQCVAGTAGPTAVLAQGVASNSWFSGWLFQATPTWMWLGGVAPACATCPAGTFAQPGAASCAPCAPGTFSLAGASACSLCPVGTYGDRAGLASAACAGACAACAAGSTSLSTSGGVSVACAPGGPRAIPPSLGLQLWPASSATNPAGVDLVVAPQPLCAQLTPGGACNTTAANSVVGADGVTRYAVGTASASNVVAAEPMTCSAV